MSDLQNIAGPPLISLLLNTGFYGILLVQVYLYHVAFPEDRPWVKCLVYAVFIIESFQTAYFAKALFDTFVYGFLNPASLDEIGFTWFIVPVLSGIVTFVSQAFYVYRITVLGGSKIAGALIIFLALTQLCGSLWIGVDMFHVKLFSRLLARKSRIIVGVCTGIGVLCDVIIAILMTYLLTQSMSLAKGQTKNHLQKLVRLLIETGSLTACFTALNIILAEANTNYYQVTSTVLSKMYANTLVVVLNSRMSLSPSRDLDGKELEVQVHNITPLEFASPSIFIISTESWATSSNRLSHDFSHVGNIDSKGTTRSRVGTLDCIPE